MGSFSEVSGAEATSLGLGLFLDFFSFPWQSFFSGGTVGELHGASGAGATS